jgi:hypothetical protein
MEIRFVSSLTPDDESLFAPALLKAIGALLDQMPIAYTVRIETTGAQVFQHTHVGEAPSAAAPGGLGHLTSNGGRLAAVVNALGASTRS